MTYYLSGDMTERLGEYRTVTEARKEAVRFMKKYPKAYAFILIRDGRKHLGIVTTQPGIVYRTTIVKDGRIYALEYDINSDGTLGEKRGPWLA